jgi:sec-independent protein translocase protein TatA
MGSFSIWHWLILIMVAALLFGGKGKISSLMGDLASGIKNFKEGLKEQPAEAIADKRDGAEVKKAEEVKQG